MDIEATDTDVEVDELAGTEAGYIDVPKEGGGTMKLQVMFGGTFACAEEPKAAQAAQAYFNVYPPYHQIGTLEEGLLIEGADLFGVPEAFHWTSPRRPEPLPPGAIR